jgi:ABC-type nickel/cobalt efflux system permease component RcnA
MDKLPWWLQYLQAVAVVLIPLVGAWIAWQQVRIARVKLQFDLYEKRFAVFQAARKLFGEAISQGNISTPSLNAYVLGTADAGFLLDDKISGYLRDAHEHAVMLSSVKSAIEPLVVGTQQRIDLSRKAGEELTWFNDQADTLTALFKPFLKLDARKRQP